MYSKASTAIQPLVLQVGKIIYNSSLFSTSSWRSSLSRLSTCTSCAKLKNVPLIHVQKNCWENLSEKHKMLSIRNSRTNYSLLFSQQRRFYNKRDTRLNADNLSEEELKVLEELEREEARIKEERAISLSFETERDSHSSEESTHLRGSISQDFVPFEDQQRIIQDVIEEIWNPLPQPEKEVYYPPEEFLIRGKSGVFELGELIDLIRGENGFEIVAISLPKELDYADYMVIVTARSQRHLFALGQYVRKRFKMKNLKRTDVIPNVISEDSKQGWIALDLGNIILHIFLQKQRDFYDLEMLWTVGPMFDDLCNAKDPEIIQLLNMMK